MAHWGFHICIERGRQSVLLEFCDRCVFSVFFFPDLGKLVMTPLSVKSYIMYCAHRWNTSYIMLRVLSYHSKMYWLLFSVDFPNFYPKIMVSFCSVTSIAALHELFFLSLTACVTLSRLCFQVPCPARQP